MSGSGGLCQVLGFAPRRANSVQRSLQRAAMTKAGSWTFQRTLYRIDRPLHRWTAGRVTLPGLATAIPVIMLTTTGAKSGLARTMPVAGIPSTGAVTGGIWVMGTNYAQPKTPAWVFNLIAEPRCSVQWRDRSASAIAVRVEDEAEREAAWAQAARYYAGFTKYRERIQDREVRIFRLTGTDALDR